jgi:hypothetical protein
MGNKSYSKGISWFDDCRIPFVDEGDIKSATPGSLNATGEFSSFGFKSGNELNTQGRFPANLLVSDDMLNDGIITKQSQRTYKPTDNSASLFGNSPQAHGTGIGDSGSSSRYYNIDKWFENLIK